MKNHFIWIIFILGALIISCNPDDETIKASGNSRLLFSTDTVAFDTLITDTMSYTKRLRISNPNKKAINIDQIVLGAMEESNYSIIVNGKPGPLVKDQLIFGGDSILVLIDVKITPQNRNLPYLVKDSILIFWDDRQKDIKLVSWGQDVKTVKEAIICDTTWTANRPYFITESILIDTLCTLTINAGTQIYLGKDVSIFNKGTLKVLGDSSSQVLFSNSRFDTDYREAPGQWGGIFFLEGSRDNVIDFATIENGQIGLRVGSPDDDDIPDIIVKHSQIRHMSVAGILTFTSDLHVENTLIYNVGQYLVGNFVGGNYTYLHCTFSNEPNFFINNDPSVQFSDHLLLDNNEILEEPLNVTMINSIIWGNGDEELGIVVLGNVLVDIDLSNNVIRSNVTLENNHISTEPNYPGFVDPSSFNYLPDSISVLINSGLNTGISDDITGKIRDSLPDIGAYEF